jgi:hypothetical protein
MANDFGRAGVKTPKGLKAANVRTNRTGKNKDIRSAKKRDKILASSPDKKTSVGETRGLSSAAKKRKKKRIMYEHPLAKAFNGENDISFFFFDESDLPENIRYVCL